MLGAELVEQLHQSQAVVLVESGDQQRVDLLQMPHERPAAWRRTEATIDQHGEAVYAEQRTVTLTARHDVESWTSDANVTDDLRTDQFLGLNAHVLLQEVDEIAGARYAIARCWVQSECAVLAGLGQLPFELQPVGGRRTMQVNAVLQARVAGGVVQQRSLRLTELLNEIGGREDAVTQDPIARAAEGVACSVCGLRTKERTNELATTIQDLERADKSQREILERSRSLNFEVRTYRCR